EPARSASDGSRDHVARAPGWYWNGTRLLLGRAALGRACRGGCCRRCSGCRCGFAFGAFNGFLFLLLGLLDDQLDDLDLGQTVRAASVGPTVFLLHLQDAVTAR